MAENISAELAYLHLFEDMRAIVFSPRGIWFGGGGHFCRMFSILRCLHKTCNESVYEQLDKSNL